jgi:hypothetical protein
MLLVSITVIGAVLAACHTTDQIPPSAPSFLPSWEVENARQFIVRLPLDGEDAPQLIKYNVLGRQPVWIFRLDDYEMFLHWEHPMDESPTSPVPR